MLASPDYPALLLRENHSNSFHLPQVCLCCASDRDHHGDIEKGEEQDREEEEDKEGDLMDWVPLKQKVHRKMFSLGKSTSGMSSMAQKADSGAGGPSG